MVGKKAASSAEAKLASWGVVHLESRWRGVGGRLVVVVDGGGGVGWGGGGGGAVEMEVGVEVMGTWMLGMDGCFGDIWWFVVGDVVVVVVVMRFCFGLFFDWPVSTAEEEEDGGEEGGGGGL